jgi:hypothetical protein
MQDMIHSPEGSGFLYGHQVTGLLYHTDKPMIASSITADRAGIGFGKGKTSGTQTDRGMQGGKIVRQGACLRSRAPQEIQGQPGCRFPAYTRQPC